jgi:protocatechuate 3,4-dioxygenase beta subunit
MTMRPWWKRIREDRNGGIEGLPLQLMIMVMVAGIGSAIIIGWMGGLSAPQTISTVIADPAEIVLSDDNGDGVYLSNDIQIVITVSDQDGNAVVGASVSLDGSSIRDSGRMPHMITDSNGQVSFEGLSAQRSGRGLGFIEVTVVKSGMANSGTTSIPVICE